MADIALRRMGYFGLCASVAYMLIAPIGPDGSLEAEVGELTRLRLDDAFKKVTPLLDNRQYDEAGAALREIAISRTREGARTDGWTGIKGGPDKVDIQ